MKSIYDSAFHHPLAAWIAGGVLLLLLARRLPFLLGFLLVFTVEIIADALVTGAWSPVASDSPLYQPLSIVFVILGDLRYFLLAERYTRPSVPFARILAICVPIALLVPIVSGVGSRVIPAMADPRVLYLVYELMLLGLVAVLQWSLYGRRDTLDPSHAAFVRKLSLFVMVQYAGWATADIVILSGAEVGHLLRIVPNVMYYAAFMPFVYFVAPPDEVRV